MDNRDYSLDRMAWYGRQRIEDDMVRRLKRSSSDSDSEMEAEAAIELQRKLDADRISVMLSPRLNPSGEIFGQASIAQAARICMQAADALAGRHIQLDIDKIEDRYNVWLPFDALEREAYAYLEERVFLDGFINDYSGILDPLGTQGHSVEVTCGLVFKWLDEQIEIDYLEQAIGKITDEDVE